MKIFIFFLNFLLTHAVYIDEDTPISVPQIWPCKYTENVNVTKRVVVKCESLNLATLGPILKKFGDIKIHRLDLLEHQFSVLYGSLFHTTILEELYFTDTPLTRIDDFVLKPMKDDLKILSFINTNLTEFPTEALKPLTNLKFLKIDGSEITKIDKNSFTNLSWSGIVETIHLTNGAIADIEAGSFVPFKKLKRLYLNNNKLTVLKKNQFQGLREVESLDLSHNEIIKVDTSHIGDLSKLVYFNASHNQLTEISRGAFARNSVLRLLNLAHNKIKRLDQHSFRGMRFLSRLFLNDNAITDVSRGTFESVKRIGVINLARNLITKIDFGMFFELNYVETIDMAENRITAISKQAFKDLYLTSINISHNQVSVMEQGAFENCVNMTLLDLSHNNITDFVKGVFDENSYPGEFNLSYNFLTNFSRIPLAHMTGIRFLNVSFNNISTIPKQTQLKLYELHTIDASHNVITEIYDNIFQPAIALRFLNLSYNALEKLKVSTFGAITTLLQLDLSHNRLKIVPKDTFIKLVSLFRLTLSHNLLEKMITPSLALSQLDFSHNQLSAIDASVWPVMNALLTLDLTNNTLNDNLVDENFASLLTLRELHLSHNNITKISKGSFRGLNTLQYLGLSNNQITEVEKDAFGKMSIFVLNLHENRITKISDLSFMNLGVLSTLNLSSNEIQHLPSESFRGMLSLKIIDLSDNKIERTENKTHSVFEPLLNLEEIHLRKNRISFLSKVSIPYNQWFAYKIRYLDLSYNIMPILTNDITIGTQNLEHLNLSHNYVQEIRVGVLGKMASLKTLDLSFNNIRDFNQTFAPNFKKLYLQNNKMHTLSWSYLANLTNLEELDLRFNNMSRLNDSLLLKVQAGMKMSVEGNPLECDCQMRPFAVAEKSNKTVKLDFDKAMCNGQVIEEIPDEMMVCSDDVKDEIYNHLTGLQFKVVRFTKGLLWFSWQIKGTGDIADFYVNVRNIDDRQTLHEFHIPYDQRTANISLGNFAADNMEVCLLSTDSTGKIDKYDKHQCFDLHAEWKMLNKKCYRNAGRHCDIFDAKQNAFRMLSTSDGATINGSGMLLLLGVAFVQILLNWRFL